LKPLESKQKQAETGGVSPFKEENHTREDHI